MGVNRAGRRRHAHAATSASRSISFYAAGIGVMFLLFSMVGAAGGVLLDEVESGTLERLLCTQHRDVRESCRQVGVPGRRRLRAAERDVPVGASRVRFAALFASRLALPS